MLKYEPESGESLWICIQNAIAQAKTAHQEVEFCFNDTVVIVQPQSHEYDIGTIWNLKRKLQQLESH